MRFIWQLIRVGSSEFALNQTILFSNKGQLFLQFMWNKDASGTLITQSSSNLGYVAAHANATAGDQIFVTKADKFYWNISHYLGGFVA